MEVVEQAHRLGVPMAYGTDLIGAMHRRQSEEFELRADLVPAADLLRSVTVTGASADPPGERARPGGERLSRPT